MNLRAKIISQEKTRRKFPVEWIFSLKVLQTRKCTRTTYSSTIPTHDFHGLCGLDFRSCSYIIFLKYKIVKAGLFLTDMTIKTLINGHDFQIESILLLIHWTIWMQKWEVENTKKKKMKSIIRTMDWDQESYLILAILVSCWPHNTLNPSFKEEKLRDH